MVSKGTLGTAYIVGTGLGLGVVLLARLLVVPGVGVDALVQTSVGFLLAGSLVAAALWLDRSAMESERVWQIAQWCGVGIGSLVLVALVVVASNGLEGIVSNQVGHLLITNVGAGGMVGVLFGTIRELRKENDRVRGLNERNRVLTRVLRHNIRNEMSQVIGYADLIEARHDEHLVATERIRSAAQNVSDLSRKARHTERALERGREVTTVDALPMVEEAVERARTADHDVTLATEQPATAPVWADEQLHEVVWNLIENAVEHGGRSPKIEVRLRTDHPSGRTAISVADDGEGIPRSELAVLADGGEAPLSHGSGLGLWLVKWNVDGYGGEVVFEENEPSGSVVTVLLEQAS